MRERKVTVWCYDIPASQIVSYLQLLSDPSSLFSCSTMCSSCVFYDGRAIPNSPSASTRPHARESSRSLTIYSPLSLVPFTVMSYREFRTFPTSKRIGDCIIHSLKLVRPTKRFSVFVYLFLPTFFFPPKIFRINLSFVSLGKH